MLEEVEIKDRLDSLDCDQQQPASLQRKFDKRVDLIILEILWVTTNKGVAANASMCTTTYPSYLVSPPLLQVDRLRFQSWLKKMEKKMTRDVLQGKMDNSPVSWCLLIWTRILCIIDASSVSCWDDEGTRSDSRRSRRTADHHRTLSCAVGMSRMQNRSWGDAGLLK